MSKWTENSVPAAALIEYANNVTDEKSADFIPQKDRIAVFDLDGTLYCETFPIYGEWILYSDYVLNNPVAVRSEKLRDVAEELASIKKASDIPSYMGGGKNHIHSRAAAFAGMPIEDYYKVVDSFKENKAEGYNGIIRGDAFYQPMLQVVDYLIEKRLDYYFRRQCNDSSVGFLSTSLSKESRESARSTRISCQPVVFMVVPGKSKITFMATTMPITSRGIPS